MSPPPPFWRAQSRSQSCRIKSSSAKSRTSHSCCRYSAATSGGSVGCEPYQFDEVEGDIGAGKQALLVLALLLMIPWGLISELAHQIIYNILVSRPLGMHRVSSKQAGAILEEHGYASQFSPVTRHFLRSSKNGALRFAMALEQIESSWCPLTHFERREGIVYPDHHKRFFGPDEIESMRQTLIREGSVSPRKPLW